jgi:hypothetical protein
VVKCYVLLDIKIPIPIFKQGESFFSLRIRWHKMGKRDEKRRQRNTYHGKFKTGGKSDKTKKKTGGRKIK